MTAASRSARDTSSTGLRTGLDVLCDLVRQLARLPELADGPLPAGFDLALSQVHPPATAGRGAAPAGGRTGTPRGDREPTGGADDDARAVVVDLVRRAQAGDATAFGSLYDRYVDGVYRFCYHRTSSVQLAEDLTSETFFRALRAITSFRWQGRDFGAWLTTIARNLVTDHYKSSRSRLETVSDDLPDRGDDSSDPERATLARLTHEVLAEALGRLPDEQRDCVVMRFLQGLSIAETAEALERTDGAVKQLQLRAIRNLAKWLPEDLR